MSLPKTLIWIKAPCSSDTARLPIWLGSSAVSSSPRSCAARASVAPHPDIGSPATSPRASSGAPLTAGVGPMKIVEPYAPRIDPSTFSTTITNPYLPLSPGTRTIYEAVTTEGLQRTTTEVTRGTKKVMGVDTVVVHDTVTLEGQLAEDTFDWYAQDRDGNVWYFGEATKEFTDGPPDAKGSLKLASVGRSPASPCQSTPKLATNTVRSTPRASPKTPGKSST
jgi:hypothetical protein